MSSESAVRARVLVSGRVQGVGYRAFAQRVGARAGLTGGVRNLDDGRVEVVVDGAKASVEAFIEILRVGPPMAHVVELQVAWEPTADRGADFRIWY